MPTVNSDVIAHVRYQYGRLSVWFRPTSPNRGGRLYIYEDVPEALYDALMQAPSKGAFFNEHIRDAFHFTRGEPR